MLLETSALTMRFGGLVAVKNVFLKIDGNELVGLIGPNGAGKTTLFNVISGYYAPSEGRVVFAGHDLKGWKPHRITRMGLCRTFQLTRPFSHLSLLDNALVGALCHERQPKAAREVAEWALEQVGLSHRAADLAQGLPIGLRKKLELARALATKPRLLLLDEVMGGLSVPEVWEMSATIARIHASGIGVVLIEHVMAAVMCLCQRIFVLNHGELVATGTPAEVCKDRRVIEAYLGESYAHPEECREPGSGDN
ncbi:MAG: ABC transporter ATP-binding protein [Desulfobaccales bacterium]|jgi:branched-chain amino acid transport system ATP-binding protein